jgi:murein DD-endopeptidase MepM/ murein hydrolase activator NlpD
MKTSLRKYLTLMVLALPWAAQAQLESAIELMADTASWQNWPPNIGGASEEDEEDETTLFYETPLDLGLWTAKDSAMYIPAYERYEHFDTRGLFHHQQDVKQIFSAGDSISFVLCREQCDFTYPYQGELTSPFGPRWGRMHYGLDIDLETGDEVATAFEGMVRISQYHSSYGNVVVVRHNNGLETLYAHLSQRKVKPGDYVQSGQLIGLGGNTGRSYGAHLHFEVRYMGQAIDPNYLVDPGKKSLRDWEFVLTQRNFKTALETIEYTRALEARSGKKTYYTVRSGDTLSAIARKKGTTIGTLCKLNKIRPSSRLRAGQRLRVK